MSDRRGLALSHEVRTFLLTDLAESTALWESDPLAMSAALAEHDEIIADVVGRSGGRMLRSKGEGDSTFSVFADPLAAALAGRSIVDELASVSWPTLRPLVARVGAHVGPAERRGVNWFGSTVNRAARIRSLAPPGAVLVSGAVAGLVGDALGDVAELAYLGRRRLRGVSEPEELWAVIARGDVPPVIAQDRAETNIRQPDLDLVGRSDAVVDLQKLVHHHRLVTVTGAGGTGKTRLSIEVVLAMRNAFRDGVWMVDLVNVFDGGVLSAILSAAGATSLDSLAERQTLLLVDNCEHVLDEAAESVSTLLRETLELRILATSRQPLNLSTEAVFPLEPLPVPALTASPGRRSTYASYELFVERARLVNPSFEIRDSDSESLLRCLDVLDGMPLGIELAASQTRTMSLRRLADSLVRDVPALHTGRRDIAHRHRSVAATIQWSIDLLAPLDIDVLEAISVCRGFDVETAVAVTGREDVEDSIGRLIDASLIVALPADRFRLLEPVRQHATNRLHARRAFDEHAERLAHHSILIARRNRQRFYTDTTAREHLRYLVANVEQSLNWLLEHDRACEAVELMGAVGDYWFTEDQATGLRWLTSIELRLDDCDPATSAHARVALAMHRQGSGAVCAIPQLTTALRTFEQTRRRRAAARAAFWLARELALDAQQPVDHARPAIEHSLHLARAVDDPVLTCWSLIWLGSIDRRSGDEGSAEQHLTTALEVARSAGVLHPVGAATGGLAVLARRRGDIAQARRLGELAIAANRAFGDPWQQVGQLLQQAALCVDDHDLTNAALHLNEAELLATQVGDRGQLAETVAVGARILDALGMTDPAATAAAAAVHWWPGGQHTAWIQEILGPLYKVGSTPDAIATARPLRAELKAVMELLDAQPAQTSPPTL